MAATYFDIAEFPKETIEGFQHTFRVTARNASGTVDAGYAGTVHFTSTDAEVEMPPVGGIDPLAPAPGVPLVAGTLLFKVRMNTVGPQSVKAQDGVLATATAHTTVNTRSPGWGFDDEALLPYGDATSGIGASIKKALAVSTHEVDVTVTNFVQDNSPFLTGDALNPMTWAVQRLDTVAFLHVVSVTQVGPFIYRLLCLEEFGPVTVTHRASSSTLKDITGALINTPRQADFLGLLDENQVSLASKLAAHSSSVQDLANPQFPSQDWFAGTLQLTSAGDYKLESGAALVRKLILRRLISTPGDFFHMPTYGIGLRVKEPVPVSELGNLKTKIEQQCAQEPEVEQVKASLLMASTGILTVTVKATLRKTGETLEIGFKSTDQGLVF